MTQDTDAMIDDVMGKASPNRADEEPASDKAIEKQRPAAHPIFAMVKARREEITAACLGSGLGFEQLYSTLGLACVNNPEVLNCTPKSVINCIMRAAKLGLDPTGANNSAFLIPRNIKDVRTLTLMPGYGGLIDLACRDGRIQTISANVVYGDDSFEWVDGTDPTIVHCPSRDHPRTGGDFTHAYAVAHFREGVRQTEVMTEAEIRKVATGTSVWRAHPIEMAKKTVIRRLAKRLPLSGPAAEAASLMDAGERYEITMAEVGEAKAAKSASIAGKLLGEGDDDA
jgi:recombination protein RecT